MSFGDVVLGRSGATGPDLDRIFGVVPAAVTLEALTGYAPSGLGSVCFRTVDGGAFGAFARIQRELPRLITTAEFSTDTYGFGWALTRHPANELERVVNDLHVVHAAFEGGGFGPYLVCSLVGFARPDGHRLALVYTHAARTFHPFAPAVGGGRDDALEDQVKDAIGGDLPFEPDRTRWFPIWDAPAL